MVVAALNIHHNITAGFRFDGILHSLKVIINDKTGQVGVLKVLLDSKLH